MKTLKEVILEHPFFVGMEKGYLDIVAEGATEAKYNAGEILFKEGEPANRFFLICGGRVVLETHQPGTGLTLIEELRGGNVLGWSWLFQPFSWHFQARAIEPTEVVVLDGGHLLANAERDSKFGYDLMKRVARVVIHRLQAIRKGAS
jgi:CRP/FNR family cyclic AMP-dependent transcriptional regulator